MNCPKCGYVNPDGARFCNDCGASLVVEQVKENIAGARRNIWGEINEDYEEVAEEVAKAPEKANEDYIADLEMKFSDGVEDWDTTTSIKKPVKPVSERDIEEEMSKQRRFTRPEKQQPKQKERYTAKTREYYEPRGGNGSATRILLIALIALALIGLGLGIYALLSPQNGFLSSCNFMKPKDNNDYFDPETMEDGLGKVSKISGAKVELSPQAIDKYYIIVPANEGDTLIYKSSRTGAETPVVVSSKQNVAFDVSISDLLPATPIDSDFYIARPEIFREINGSREQVDVPPVKLEAPRITISGLPDGGLISDDGQIAFEGQLESSMRDAAVTVETRKVIDGSTAGSTPSTEQLTVGPDGKFKFVTSLDKGEYVFDLIASLGGYRVERKRISGTVNSVLSPENVIEIAKSFSSRSLNVEESIRVYGAIKADKGSTMTVTSNDADFSLKSDPVIDADNNFSFEVNLPVASKIYWFTITVTLPDGKVFQRPFSVERPPQYTEYVPLVWSGTYDEMIKPVHLTDKRGFQIKGTVDSIIYDADYLIAKFILEDGHTIEVEYHDHYSSALKLEAGNKYTLYGYSLGTADSSEGLLRAFIWFALNK